jgi:hypothetical protein
VPLVEGLIGYLGHRLFHALLSFVSRRVAELHQ